MVDFLEPLIGVAVAATLAPDLWCEPLLFDIFGTSGASGFWSSATTRCTVTPHRRRTYAREPRDKVDLSPACAWVVSLPSGAGRGCSPLSRRVTLRGKEEGMLGAGLVPALALCSSIGDNWDVCSDAALALSTPHDGRSYDGRDGQDVFECAEDAPGAPSVAVWAGSEVPILRASTPFDVRNARRARSPP